MGCITIFYKGANDKIISMSKEAVYYYNKNGKNEILNDYKIKALLKHNELRNKHGSPELQMNEELNKKAQEYAEKLLNNKNEKIISFNIYKDSFFGENIIISEKESPENICQKWYNEIVNYNFNIKKYQKDTGHFTQMIWKKTKEVGFGFHFDDYNNFCMVAYYYPAGNIFGEFSDNIKAP